MKLNADMRMSAKRKSLDADQADAFLATAERVALTWYPVFLLMFRTGMRPGEALALRRDDVNLTRLRIKVEREKVRDADGTWTIGPPKSRKSLREVPASDDLAEVLAPHVGKLRLATSAAAALPWLFPNEQDPATYAKPADGTRDVYALAKAMKKVLKAAGLPVVAFGFTPKSGRHTTATLLLDAGETQARVQDLLGHDDIRLTAALYGSDRKEVADTNKLNRHRHSVTGAQG
ncbi:MAG: site-specific integrase [bacterium]|nr:site-specific integrase [bacterium]